MKRIRPSLGRLLTLLFLLIPAAGSSLSVKLTSVEITVRQSRKTEEIKKLVPFAAGQQTSREEIEEKLSELNALELIQNVDYELTSSGQGGFALAVDITGTKTVRDVLVAGNYPFLNKEIARLVFLQPGTPFEPSLIPKSVENIDRFLVRNGYYRSKIEITPRPHKKYDSVDLVVKINKGETFRVGKVTVNGAKALSERRIKAKFFHLHRFREKTLKSDLKRVKNLYAKKGYVKARIKVERLDFHPETRKVDIEVSVTENKRLKISFEGALSFRKERLRQILNFKERRSYDRYSVRLSRKRLEKFYHDNGFPEAVVKTKVLKSKNEVRVTYVVERGPRVELARIRFVGNRKYSGKTLKRYIKSYDSGFLKRGKYLPDRLSKDAGRLTDFYHSQGFVDAEVSGPEIETNAFGDQKRASFTIQEGEVYKIRELGAVSDESYATSKLLKASGLKEGKDLTKDILDKAKVRMYDRIFADGYAYAKILLTARIDRENHAADLTAVVKRGPKVRIRRIALHGNDITKDKTIRNNLRLREGGRFVYQKVLDAQLNLRKLGIFSTVRVDPIGFSDKKEDIDLVVSVREIKTVVANVQAGFDSRNFGRGEVSFTKKNLFGLAKQFNARVIVGKKFDRGEATFSSPRLFGASWNLAVQGFGQYEDAPNFDADSFGGFVSMLKNFGPYWTFGFKEGITKTDVHEGSSNVALLGNSLFDNTFNTFGAFITFDNRDNFSDPQRGFYALVRDEINTDVSDVGNSFDTVNANVSHYFGFLDRFTLNNTVRYGQDVGLGNRPRVPVNKLFFQGGADTVRGFEEDGVNRAGGTLSFIYNAELHYRLASAFKLAGFFDAGVLSNNLNAVRWTDFRESAGVGFRYFTPVGPLRLDYGFILDRKPGEPSSRLHFSFGYFF